eukprot:CAMPEP_0168448924 /NCGR_PEP_ID=MMETSP0228-20121227/47342_1 /TAXON_ID=133427 /ORGANISM="Protoceratium reticulatum, Strain CCCM 535 (=CCMP 1889)" /LENGTH=48 /DNA_ID= /DNA_START= /DNA_END= /DNA_ORIENTATION=
MEGVGLPCWGEKEVGPASLVNIAFSTGVAALAFAAAAAAAASSALVIR